MNLRCATALLGAGWAALAVFVAPAALQTVKAGLDTAGRAVLCWLIATCNHELKDSVQALDRCVATSCLHTPRRACDPPKPAVSLGEKGTPLQSAGEFETRMPAETVWQLHLTCMLSRLGQQRVGLAYATRAVNELVTCSHGGLFSYSTMTLNGLQPVIPQTCARYLVRVSLGQSFCLSMLVACSLFGL